MELFTVKGPDRVRLRPQVVFGHIDGRGVLEAVKMLLSTFIKEAELGYCKNIKIDVMSDNSISIRCDGRAMLLDDTIVDGNPAWYYTFCDFELGPLIKDKEYLESLGRAHHKLFAADADAFPAYETDQNPSFEFCCVQYASRFMHVESVKDGIKKTLDFEKGYSVSMLKTEETTEEEGTYIHFLPDDEVFSEIKLPVIRSMEILESAARTIPGLKCVYRNRTDDLDRIEFYYPEGMLSAIKTESDFSAPIYYKELKATGKDRYNQKEYTAKLKVWFTFVKDRGQSYHYHNHCTIEPYCSSCLDILKDKLAFNIAVEFSDVLCSADCTYEELKSWDYKCFSDNILLYVETVCSDYIDSTCVNHCKMLSDMAEDILYCTETKSYFFVNKDELLPLIKEIKERKDQKD